MRAVSLCLVAVVARVALLANTCPAANTCPGVTVTVNGQPVTPDVTYTSPIANNISASFDTPVIDSKTNEELEIIGDADTSGSTSIDQGITLRNLTSSSQDVTVTWDLPFTDGPYTIASTNLGEDIQAPTSFTVPFSITSSYGSDHTGARDIVFYTFSGTCTDPTGASSYVTCGIQPLDSHVSTAASGFLVVSETATVSQFENFGVGGLTELGNPVAPEPATFGMMAGIFGLAGLARLGKFLRRS